MQSRIFYNLSDSIKPKLDIIRQSIKLNEKLRSITSQAASDLDNSPLFEELIAAIPKGKEWLGYENCAVVTRLYAVYESFVETLIVNWIRELPKLVPKYPDLDDRIQETHIDNVGRILRERNKQRFSSLRLDVIIRGLYYGATNYETYELLPEAFTLHDRNLRKEDLEKLFKNAGIHQHAWNWVTSNRLVKNFIEDTIKDNTDEGLLKELIDYRNDAAHGGTIEIILGSNELLQLCDFVEFLCISLSELATYQFLLKQEEQRLASKIGQITKWFKKPQAAVAKISNAKLQVGDRLFLTSNTDCQIAEIISLQIDDVSHQEVNLSSEREVGIKFDIDVRENLDIYQWITH